MKINLFEVKSSQYTVEDVVDSIKSQYGFKSSVDDSKEEETKLTVLLDSLTNTVYEAVFKVLESGEIVDTVSVNLYFASKKQDLTDSNVGLMALSSAIESALQLDKTLSDMGVK